VRMLIADSDNIVFANNTIYVKLSRFLRMFWEIEVFVGESFKRILCFASWRIAKLVYTLYFRFSFFTKLT